MSAQPVLPPASRAAARRRIPRGHVAAVVGAHFAALAGIVLLSAGRTATVVAAGARKPPGEAAAPSPPSETETVVWMDPAAFQAPATPPTATEPPPPEEAETLAPAEPSPPALEPFLAPSSADPSPSPSSPPPRSTTPPRPKPSASVAIPKVLRQPTPHRAPTPRKPRERTADRPVAARPRPQPVVTRPKIAASPAATRTESSGTGGTGTNTDAGADADGPAGAGGTDWYASMLHERFHERWEQPTSVFGSAQRYVATLRLRIERDGRISDYRLVRSSGLVPMDESVLAAAARVGRVDPPPVGLLHDGAYVVSVGFVRE